MSSIFTAMHFILIYFTFNFSASLWNHNKFFIINDLKLHFIFFKEDVLYEKHNIFGIVLEFQLDKGSIVL